MLIKSIRLTLSGLIIIISLNVFSKKLNFLEAIKLSYLTAFGNFFGPLMGGAGVKAIYLKKKYNLNYSHFLSVFYVTNLINYIISSFFGALGFLYAYLLNSSLYITLPIAIFMCIITLIGLLLIFIPIAYLQKFSVIISKFNTRIIKIYINIINGLDLLKSNRLTISLIFITSILTFICTYFVSLIEFSIIIDSFNLIEVLIYNVVSSMSIIISITPGGMGIKEGMLSFTSPTIGISPGNVLQLSLIDKGVSVLMFGIIFFINYIYIMYKKIVLK